MAAEHCAILQAQHQGLCRSLVPSAACAFSSISDDLARVAAEADSPGTTTELNARLARMRSILAIEVLSLIHI